MSCNLDEHFSAEDKHLLREQFIGNELDSDQYRDAWPEAGLHYLTPLGIPLVRGNGLDDTEALLSALLTWLQAWDAEGRGNYAGAAAARLPPAPAVPRAPTAARASPACSRW